jgi:sugar transferase (PEP-CTERM/EpsH1 system associated)
MNLLYLCHRIPYPPNKGDKIRSFHQIRKLSEQHAVHLVSFVDAAEDVKHITALGKYCRSVEIVFRSRARARLEAGLALFSGEPLSVASFRSQALRRKVEAKLATERIDLALVFSSAMAQYIPRPSTIPVLIDFVDIDSEKWREYARHLSAPRSWIYQLEGRRLARFEERAANAADHCIVISSAEAALLAGRVQRPVSVITNGVDLEYYRQAERMRPPSQPAGIVFVGAMDYFPNDDAVCFFCQEVFPIVLDSTPDATFTIVGRNPTPRVRSLANLPRVSVTGSVADVRPHLMESRLSVAPFRIARGIQNKVLEAMAMGLPVVGTALAFQGLAVTEEDGIRIADNPETMSREIVSILKDSRLAGYCSERARAYVERNHRWEDHALALEALVHRLGRLVE